MPISDGKGAVNALLTDGGPRAADEARLLSPDALRLLPSEVQKRTQQPGGVFYDCVDTCNGTGYDHRCHELRMWHVGLMLAEYVAGLIADKARDGHCHASGKTNPHCSIGRKLHLDMLARFKHDLASLIREIEGLENEALHWPKADAHPRQKPSP